MVPSQDPVTWYGISYAGTQGKSGWTGKSSFVLEVPQRYSRPSVIYSLRMDPAKGLLLCTGRLTAHSGSTWSKDSLVAVVPYFAMLRYFVNANCIVPLEVRMIS